MMGPRPATGAGRVSLAAAVVGIFALLAAVGLVGGGSASGASSWSDWSNVDTTLRGFGDSLALDHGRPRIAHRSADETVSYAWCDTGCDHAGAWDSIDLGVPALWVDLAIDRWGRPHIAYLDDEARDGVFYAVCDDNCHDSSSWTHTKVDATTDDEGLSLALDPWGRPRLAYVAFQGRGVETKYARCNEECTTAEGWASVTLPVDGGYPSLDLHGTKPRIAYTAARSGPGHDLRYLACDAGCLDDDSWSSAVVAWFEAIGTPSLVVDGEQAHIAFNPNGPSVNSLAYTRCESDCTSEEAWSDPAMLTPGESAMNPELALTRGRPRVLYTHCVNCLTAAEENHLYYAECDTGCTSEQSWVKQRLVPDNQYTLGYSLALDGERPRVLHTSGESTPRDLHYAHCDAPCGQAGSWPAPPSSPPPDEHDEEPSSSSTTTSPSGGGSGDGGGSDGGPGGGWSGGADDGGGGSSPAGSDDPGSPSGGDTSAGGDASRGEGESSDGGDGGDFGGVDGLGGSGGAGDSASGGSGGEGAVSGGVGSDGAQVDGGGAGDGSGGGASVGGVARGVGRAPGAAVDLVANPSQALSWPWGRIAVSTLAAALLAVCGWMVWVVGAARPGPRRSGGAP